MSLVDQAATSTLPKLLQRNAEQDPKGPGIREKTRGVWQTLTWTGYRDQMRDLALGLAALGFKRGDKLSVVGDNRPQLYIAQLAAQALGGISVPVYQDSIASELVYVLNHAETSIIVAEDQEQVDKALSLKDKLPGCAGSSTTIRAACRSTTIPSCAPTTACSRRDASSARPIPASTTPSSPRAAPTTRR